MTETKQQAHDASIEVHIKKGRETIVMCLKEWNMTMTRDIVEKTPGTLYTMYTPYKVYDTLDRHFDLSGIVISHEVQVV